MKLLVFKDNNNTKISIPAIIGDNSHHEILTFKIEDNKFFNSLLNILKPKMNNVTFLYNGVNISLTDPLLIDDLRIALIAYFFIIEYDKKFSKV